jgi:1,4-dihydroxy-2-naphthoyl-CoA hydrolase
VTIDPAQLTELQRGFLPDLLGMRYTEASKDRLVAELTIRDDLRTIGGALHGGTIMALADTVGATATFLNLPPGASTTTLESKTNFFAAGRDGVVRAEATPLHRGRPVAGANDPDADGAGAALTRARRVASRAAGRRGAGPRRPRRACEALV